MDKSNDIRAAANRIRSASESLINPKDVQLVREYLTELEMKAVEQEANDNRRIAGVRHLSADNAMPHRLTARRSGR